MIGVRRSTNARFRIRMFPCKDLMCLEPSITAITAMFPAVHTRRIATYTIILGILNPSGSGGGVSPGKAELFIFAAF